jgi:hypothetical protein
LRNQRKKKENKDFSSTNVATTPNSRTRYKQVTVSSESCCSKKAATAPLSTNPTTSNFSKSKDRPGILTPSASTAGIVPSHTNIGANPQKNCLKGKQPENLTKPIEQDQVESENDELLDDPQVERQSIVSDCSEETEYTSMTEKTEVKERASTCTLVRNIWVVGSKVGGGNDRVFDKFWKSNNYQTHYRYSNHRQQFLWLQ